MSDLLNLGGTDLIGLQELGGCQDVPVGRWDKKPSTVQGQSYTFVVANPMDSFRSLAIGYPSYMTPFVNRVTVLPCGLCVHFRSGGVNTFARSVHLPYTSRDDSAAVWQSQIQAMHDLLATSRYHDCIYLMTDLNYELVHATAEMADERSALLQLLLRDLGLSHTKPTEATWSNSRGSSSKIDYVLYRTPSQETLDQGVATGSDELLGSDHQLITLCVAVNKGPRKRVRQRRTNCGKWVVDYTKAVPLCNKLACDADVSGADVDEEAFLRICRKSCFRPRSFRFRDTPEIKQLIEDRRRSQDPRQKRQLGRDIVASRAEAKKAWRMELLDRAAAGDYQVISYFRRKQSLNQSQLDYCLKVGGVGPAVGGLKSFYAEKYDPVGTCHLHDAMHLYQHVVGPRMPAPKLLTREELEMVLLQTKSGKSYGCDGAPYEFWCAVLQSEACDHLLDFLNEVLLENQGFPSNWLLSHIVLLPKVKEPANPKDFRPIVLAATLSKLLTKACYGSESTFLLCLQGSFLHNLELNLWMARWP